MKKIIFFSLLLILALTFNVSALPDDPDEIREILKNNFGFTDEDIPRDKEDIRQLYLKVRITEKIKNNNFLGRIHNLLNKVSIVFRILMAHPYELSLKFFSIFTIWLVILAILTKILTASGFIKGWHSFIIAIVGTTVLAQMRVYQLISTAILDFLFKQDSWTMRIIIIAIALGIFIFLVVFANQFAAEMEKRRKGTKEEQADQKLKEMEALSKGLQKKIATQ